MTHPWAFHTKTPVVSDSVNTPEKNSSRFSQDSCVVLPCSREVATSLAYTCCVRHTQKFSPANQSHHCCREIHCYENVMEACSHLWESEIFSIKLLPLPLSAVKCTMLLFCISSTIFSHSLRLTLFSWHELAP